MSEDNGRKCCYALMGFENGEGDIIKRSSFLFKTLPDDFDGKGEEILKKSYCLFKEFQNREDFGCIAVDYESFIAGTRDIKYDFRKAGTCPVNVESVRVFENILSSFRKSNYELQ